jgi:hypothetical protein
LSTSHVLNTKTIHTHRKTKTKTVTKRERDTWRNYRRKRERAVKDVRERAVREREPTEREREVVVRH